MMADIREDPDARLVLALYHDPLASETRRHLSERMLAEMDQEVAVILGGGSSVVPSMEGLMRALGNMPEEQAEATGRQIAGVIRRHLAAELARLNAELAEAGSEADQAASRLGDLEAERERLLRKIEGEGQE